MKALLVVVLLALAARTAAADDPPSPKPWAVGVSQAEQDAALALYEQGNAEFHGARFAQALAKYREALAHWDHPAIHFNMAVCLINLDQPLEAKQHLDRALAFGPDAIGAEMYEQGLTYEHMLDAQISKVRISCREPGATITLDGAFAFTAPGEIERIVKPGKHQIVATKPGFLTASETLELQASKLTHYDVRLVAFHPATVTHFERRWARWKPYAVLGGGGATAALGGVAYLLAAREFRRYDDAVAAACPRGCDAATRAQLDLEGHHRQGRIDRAVAYSLFALGGAAIVTGVVGAIMNQPHPVIEHAAIEPARDGAIVTWAGSW